jgi:PAS domain S-box-containing protein
VVHIAEPEVKRRSSWWWPTTFLALFLLTVGAVYSLSTVARANRWVKHTGDVRVAIGELLSTFVGAESAMRGYAASGDPAFLKPYDGAQSQWRPQFYLLRSLTTDNPRQQARLDRLERLLGERLASLSRLRTTRQTGHSESELALSMLDGNREMDGIRALVKGMDEEESRLDNVRQADAIRRWRWTMVLFVGGAFAFWLVVVAASIQRRDAESRRLRAEEVSRANELFRVVLEGTDLGITVQDVTGGLIYANAAAAGIIGFTSAGEMLAATPMEVLARFELFTVEGAPFPAEQLPGRTALSGNVTEETPLRFRVRGRSEERWAAVRAVPVRDLAGKVIFAINFFREVTEEVRDKQHRAFLLRAVDELTSSLDYRKTLATVTKLAVPVLADWCAIDLVDGGATKRLAIAHVDPAKLQFVAEIERRYPPDPDSPTGVPEILRTGRAEFIPDIPRDLLADAAVDEEHLRLIDELQLTSYIGVPLKARGQVIGVFTIAMAESGRRHTERDLELAKALAGRAALAIDNARLFQDLGAAQAITTKQRDQSEERFRLMVESVKDYAIFMLDPQGVITTWNSGAQLIKGYRPEEIIGRHFSCFYGPEEVRAGKCETELEIAIGQGRFEEEGWRVRKNGSRFWASVVITAVRDSRGQLRGFAKVTRDLTERRRTRDELAVEARRRLEAESQTRFAETFVGILGHDLRNPLNAISMAVTLMKRKGTGDLTRLDRIQSSTVRMSNMVAQLLDLTRSRLAGGISVERKPTDLLVVTAETIDELRLVNPGRDIRLEEAGGIDGRWDPDRLAQVVSNLVGNALQHGDPSKPITVRLLPVDDGVRFVVHSFGPVIPPEVLSVIFDPYRRTTVRTAGTRGLGLGLFISQQIVAAHNGTIECRSTEEEGTTVTVTLPQRPADKVASAAAASTSEAECQRSTPSL